MDKTSRDRDQGSGISGTAVGTRGTGPRAVPPPRETSKKELKKESDHAITGDSAQVVGSKAAEWKYFTKVAQNLNEKKKCTGKCNFCGHQSYREEIGPQGIREHRDFGFGPERGKR